MIKFIVGTLIVGILLSGTAYGKSGKIGFGFIVGEPTGLVAKKWLSETTAVDGAVGWSNNSLHLHGDYLRHNNTAIQLPEVEGDISVYYGLGARIEFNNNNKDDDVMAGIRIPVGINYLFNGSPLDVFVEIAPIMDLVPYTELDISAAIGIRYFFP